jgi:uncharacterized protein with PIN domain
MIYLCLRCNTFHGWIDHPDVQKVTKHERYPQDEIWWCPKCNRQHGHYDGSMFGQRERLYQEVSIEEMEDYLTRIRQMEWDMYWERGR